MNRHLSDHEIAAAVAAEKLAPERARHLEDCVPCRREVDGLLELIAERRRALEAEAPDFEEQRRRILERLDRPAAPVVALRRRQIWRPVLAAAAALVAVVGIWFQMTRHRPAAVVRTLPVEQILSDVDATLADQSVPGFERLDTMIPAPDEMASLIDDTKTAS